MTRRTPAEIAGAARAEAAPLALTLTRAEAVSLEVALGLYLETFSLKAIAEAPETSGLRNTLRMWNKTRNLLQGAHVGYMPDRLPVRGEY